ncbi:DUF2971 domain-containing protein [Agrobacterium leguminum]|uniref:DUF2971 domain-containing protein n=1 Tax=Agrobacterium deltaense NCPPB 1641 TaxID=1183425 RepID=A0A1S7U2H0_9HYPH|nr:MULTISPECIES: DUF2971 domain-containing protein [Agrobacterium]WFS67424.1 DUF2971 domain-containing protein [Agrobacterium leguminum]CVI60974.1 conserved hypothetical protein [Agrobacterium deltaense NCPPB 1641]
MQLYYYTKLQYGLASVRDKRIKISLYDSLNDPFDFLGVATDSKDQRKELKAIRDEISAKSGIICLSETWKEPLMWGHYAEAHKGVCLGFEVRAGHYEQIKYRAERPRLADFGKTSIHELTDEDKAQIAFRKFNHWSYEREWRRVVDLEPADFVDGNHYLRFDGSMVLKYILFGSRAKISSEQIKRIASANPNVKLAITSPANTAFDIVIDKFKTEESVPEDNRVLQLPVPDRLEFEHAIEKMIDSSIQSVMTNFLRIPRITPEDIDFTGVRRRKKRPVKKSP